MYSWDFFDNFKKSFTPLTPFVSNLNLIITSKNNKN